uniref:AT-rich interaction domain 4A n=1 Tax=Ornithorhynchus anatinus TaxID=9258 RepID=A0A6I8NVL4_ORNAN
MRLVCTGGYRLSAVPWLFQAADEPAYLTVGTDVSAKYRGAFCEAKIKTVKRLVKVKVILKQDNSTQLVQDDQVKGPLRVGAIVETKVSDGSFQEAVISKLTDASWYTVVFDDGDERTLRRTSLCLKGERHFAESETLDQLPLTNPEHFGTPVIGKKSNRGRRSSLPITEDEKEEESSEEEDEDKRRLNDELLGKVVSVTCTPEKSEWYLALVVSPSCNDDITVKRDQCLVRSFADSKLAPFHGLISKMPSDPKSLGNGTIGLAVCELRVFSLPGLQEASSFLKTKAVPDHWKMDISEILESSSSDEEGGTAEESEEEKEKEDEKEEEEVPEDEPDPEERDNFLQQLYKFMEDRGTPINKPPVLGYKDLNLFKLFRLVYQQGGCDSIDSGAVWKQIYMDLGIPILNSAASYNVKTAYRKYLYGFEEYCRSANIQFRTIHHNEPRVVEEIQKQEESMAESAKVEPEMPPVEVKNEVEENVDSNSESEREEIELKSPRGRRKIARDATPVKKEMEDDRAEDKAKDSNKENKDVEEETAENAEKKEGEVGRRVTPKLKEKKIKKQEESDRDSDEEDEKRTEREETEHKGESEGEEDESDMEPCLTGTKVKVKYGRGKTQKIYEASIKSTETDDGEVLYLVHYYGWNVRYDEWVKADRIIWPLEKGGPKRKQKKKAKNKDEGEREEKKDEERQKSKRGRPPLKSTLPSNPWSRRVSCFPFSFLSDSGSSDSEVEDPSEKNLLTEELSPEISEDLEKSEKLPGDRSDDENPKIPEGLNEGDRPRGQEPSEALKSEVEESEQIGQVLGSQTEQAEEGKRESEKSPKGKGRRSKPKQEPSLETARDSPPGPEDCRTESQVDFPGLEAAALDRRESPSAPEDESDPCSKEKKVKRKLPGQSSPEKKARLDGEKEVPDIVAEERPGQRPGAEENRGPRAGERLEPENEEMPALTAESDRLGQEEEEVGDGAKEGEGAKEEEDDTMPLIGPETLVCHEVDLDDLDEKEKSGSEDSALEKSDPNAPASNPPALPPALPPHFSAASPLALSQDESRSVKSESDLTVEVDSVAEESQEAPCEVDPADGLGAVTATPTSCGVMVPEKESRDKGPSVPVDASWQSSDSEDLSVLDGSSKCTPVKHIGVTKPQKLARSPARMLSPHIKDGEKDKHREKHQNASPRAYKWSFQLNELDSMNSAERISFLQEKLQEIRKYYMSLKSEVATIDRRRKRLKKKDREVSHTGASMSSASSDTGMSPSSSSPPQNVLAVECR